MNILYIHVYAYEGEIFVDFLVGVLLYCNVPKQCDIGLSLAKTRANKTPMNPTKGAHTGQSSTAIVEDITPC